MTESSAWQSESHVRLLTAFDEICHFVPTFLIIQYWTLALMAALAKLG